MFIKLILLLFEIDSEPNDECIEIYLVIVIFFLFSVVTHHNNKNS